MYIIRTMRLTDEELRDVLARAEEIQRASRIGRDAELRAVISAAEEVGLERAAVEQALRERLDVPLAPPAAGELVFAQSADDKYYVAEVLSASPDSARVRYLRGSEHTVTLDRLRPCAFLPGSRVTCHWPWWGPWTCTVISYDAAKQRVKLSDGWGATKTFNVSDVWIEPPRKSALANRRRIYITLLGWGAGVGAVVGYALTRLLIP
jgi:hypothetical protein